MHLLSALLALPLLASLTAAHGLFLQVPGSNGKTGRGLGTEGATIKGHTAFYHAPRFLGRMAASATCGANRRKGGTTFYPIDWQSSLSSQIRAGLPSTSGNTVTMKYFQVNGDGAGPFTCEVSTDAKGTSWKAMKVTTNVPGNSAGKSTLTQRYHTLKAQLPSGTKCTGKGGACLVRCKNPNTNPFGGCMAVKKGSSSARSKRHAELAERHLTEADEEEEEDDVFDEPAFEDEEGELDDEEEEAL